MRSRQNLDSGVMNVFLQHARQQRHRPAAEQDTRQVEVIRHDV